MILEFRNTTNWITLERSYPYQYGIYVYHLFHNGSTIDYGYDVLKMFHMGSSYIEEFKFDEELN